jgi:hypothetical protein
MDCGDTEVDSQRARLASRVIAKFNRGKTAIEAGMNLHRFSGSTKACLHHASVQLSNVTSRKRLKPSGVQTVPARLKAEFITAFMYGLKSVRENSSPNSVQKGQLSLAQDDSPGLDFKGRPVP